MILALDTATEMVSLALHDGKRLRWESAWPVRSRHTVELGPAVEQVLHTSGVAVGELSAIAVSLGPGSFTALRIGIAFAKGMALAQNLRVLGVPTFEVLVHGQIPKRGVLIAVVQAGRGRVAAALYEHKDDRWRQIEPPGVYTWSALGEHAPRRARVCGEIDDEGRAILARRRDLNLLPGAWSLRRAGFLAELAWESVRARRSSEQAELIPIYLNASAS